MITDRRETLQTVWERPRNISRSGQVRDRVSEARGQAVKKGNRWVERVLSLRHTCRIWGRPSFPTLVEAIACLCKGETPALSWITYSAGHMN